MAKHGIRLWIDAHRPAPEGWTTATSVDAARSLIESGVEELSISADIQNLRENGLALVVWMARTGSWPHARPTVHGAKIPAKVIDTLLTLAWPLRTRLARHAVA